MSTRTRAAAVITGALTATTIAAVGAFAAPSMLPAMAGTDGQPTHMEELDEATITEMASMMTEDATVGQMHRWMTDNGIPIGEMHREMTMGGTNPGTMHRGMAPPTG